jgi:hypothetical protein
VLVRLALKAHHAPAAAGLSLAICALTVLLNGHTIMLPQLLAGLTRPVNIGLLFAVGFAPTSAYLFGGDSMLLEAQARRSLIPVDLALGAVITAPILLAACMALTTRDTSTALGVARDGCAFIAATLFLLTLARPSIAATVPVLYFLAISTVGLKSDGSAHIWAWLRAQPSPASCAVSIALLALAVTAFHFLARRQAAARRPLEDRATI